ncbi:hypothetical protein GCM10018790_67150 [Kitasatospora xanthocidica]|nr:hypothetical protein GCM10018790_67150 [Kitasatospora xanthocidica]
MDGAVRAWGRERGSAGGNSGEGPSVRPNSLVRKGSRWARRSRAPGGELPLAEPCPGAALPLAEPCQYRTGRPGVSTADGAGRRARTARTGAGTERSGRAGARWARARGQTVRSPDWATLEGHPSRADSRHRITS